jgi:hypothetical protein
MRDDVETGWRVRESQALCDECVHLTGDLCNLLEVVKATFGRRRHPTVANAMVIAASGATHLHALDANLASGGADSAFVGPAPF